MRKQRVIFLLLLLCTFIASCSPGHLGSNVLAFIRNGHLWTSDPDGANAFEVVAQDASVVGYTWSPTHQILSYRILDTDFAKTSVAKHLSANSTTGLITDTPSTLNTIGVDGGTPISIAFSSPDIRYSNAAWNANGTRLLYRQTATSFSGNPSHANWWISQNDQPGGIAIKSLPGSYSIPSLSYVTQHYQALGNSSNGLFTTSLAGTQLHALTSEPLPGHPLPASLERILWQPGHQDHAFLYARTLSANDAPSTGTSAAPLSVQLVIQSLSGQLSPVSTCTCTQFSWSPDGNSILFTAGTKNTILNIQNNASFSFDVENGSVPYWSPDAAFLLLDAPHGLVLVNVSTKQQISLLKDSQPQENLQPVQGDRLTTSTLLQPIANSLWAADSRHFLFLTHDRLLWQGKLLHPGKGLYTVSIDTAGHPQGDPTVVNTGDDTQAGWTYQDPNTSFLY
jgi:hypothetical protein